MDYIFEAITLEMLGQIKKMVSEIWSTEMKILMFVLFCKHISIAVRLFFNTVIRTYM